MQTMYLQVKKQMVSAVFHVVLAYYISLFCMFFSICLLYAVYSRSFKLRLLVSG